MKIVGKTDLPYSREKLWEYLNDVNILQLSVPDCEYINELSETELEGALFAKVGPIKARFTGIAIREKMNPPESCILRVEGKGGNAGFGSAVVEICLIEVSPTETTLEYEVDAQLGGKLAQLGSRLIESTAQLMSDKFFTQFADVVNNGGRLPGSGTSRVSMWEIIIAFFRSLFKRSNKETS